MANGPASMRCYPDHRYVAIRLIIDHERNNVEVMSNRKEDRKSALSIGRRRRPGIAASNLVN